MVAQTFFGGEGILALFTVGVEGHGVEFVQLHDPNFTASIN